MLVKRHKRGCLPRHRHSRPCGYALKARQYRQAKDWVRGTAGICEEEANPPFVQVTIRTNQGIAGRKVVQPGCCHHDDGCRNCGW